MIGTSAKLNEGTIGMPSQKDNPLTEDGLPAKIANYCFIKRLNGYQLSLQIYKNNNPSRICRYLQKFENRFFSNLEGGYYTLSAPLVTELQAVLNRINVKLGDHEVKTLLVLFDSNHFRKWIGSAIAVDLLAKSGHNIVTAISTRLAADSTYVILMRRLGKFQFDERRFTSMFHYFQWFKEEFSLLELRPYMWEDFDNSRKEFDRLVKGIRPLYDDLFPEIAADDVSYYQTKQESENVLNYYKALELLPFALLRKLLELNRESARLAVWPVLFPGVKQ